MKKCTILLPGILLILLSSAAVYSDPLWDSAVEFYSRGLDWEAGQMILESSQTDRKGRLKEHWEMEYRLSDSGYGESDWVMVWARKDGHPATEDEIEKMGENDEQGPPDDGYFDGIEILALNPEEQSRVIPHNTGQTVFIDGKELILYNFTHRYEGGAETSGEVLINAEGIPVKMNYHFTNLPFYMKKMNGELTLIQKEDAVLVNSMFLEGQVSLLIVKMGFSTRMTFDNFSLGSDISR